MDLMKSFGNGKLRVLQDLSLAMLGHSGIPQDTRLMFKTFSQLPGVELTGLLSEMGPGRTRGIATTNFRSKQFGIFQGSLFLLAVSGIEIQASRRRGVVRRLLSAVRPKQINYKIAPMDFDVLNDSIWRIFFQKTLDPEDRSLIQSQRFAFTNLNFASYLERLNTPIFTPPALNTEGYDILVTSEPRPIRLATGTRHVARFHDAIPLTDPDMFSEADVIRTAFRMIQRSSPATMFACVSQPSEDTLLRLFPALKGRTTTIPNAIPTIRDTELSAPPLEKIIHIRTSDATFGHDEDSTALRLHALRMAKLDQPFRYIVALSTVEPRKNFSSLVRAWERVRYQGASDLKLIIVGRPGWRFDSTLTSMRAGILSGQILHLQDVPPVELRAILKSAECLVSPSFAEGFGFPPLEAMQFGTPAIVSDVASHRWVLGDAALYVDPYNVQDMAQKISQLVISDDRHEIRRTMRLRAAPRLSRYTVETVSGQWAELFERMQAGEAPRPGTS